MSLIGRSYYDKTDGVETLDSWFKESTYRTKPATVWLAPIWFVVASVMGGVILSLMALPALFIVSGVTQAGLDTWEALPSDLPLITLPQRSYIQDSEGNQIAEFYSENRDIVGLESVSKNVIDALIAVEDSRFYEHQGIDGTGVLRALRNNSTAGGTEGASTITQQLVKNTLLLAATTDEERQAATENTIHRKVYEAHYAMELEKTQTKDEILEQYLNVVLFSNGVYGIGTAAKYYFNVSVDELTLPQSAMLVGLLKNPTGYDPIDHPEAALARRNVVIDRMYANGYINIVSRDTAKKTELGINVTRNPNGCSASPYPFFCQWVVEDLKNDTRLGSTESERSVALYNGGIIVKTTLSPSIQNSVQSVADNALGRDNRVAAGISVVEPGTGRVLALVQNRDWGTATDTTNIQTEIVLPAAPSFQPGSSFKPFTLAAALESGFPPDSIMYAPSVFNPGDMNVPPGGITNLARYDAGNLTIDQAMAFSSNTYFATLAYKTGVLRVAEMAKSLGISVPNTVTSKDSSFALGTTSTSSLEMAAAYAAFASGGLYCAPTGVDSISSLDGSKQYLATDGKSNCYQAISKATASKVTQSLVAVISGPERNRTGKKIDIAYPAGGKTGTTTNHSAAWFVGTTPQMSMAVWMGDPRGGFKYPLTGGIRFYGKNVYDVYASDIAAPLWNDAMNVAMAGQPVEDFDFSSTDSLSGVHVVPTVIGLSVDYAVLTLKNQGFKVVVSEDKVEPTSESIPSGVVISQTPDAGQTIFNTAAVTVTLTITQ